MEPVKHTHRGNKNVIHTGRLKCRLAWDKHIKNMKLGYEGVKWIELVRDGITRLYSTHTSLHLAHLETAQRLTLGSAHRWRYCCIFCAVDQIRWWRRHRRRQERQRCGQEIGMIWWRHKTQDHEPVSMHNHEVQVCSPDGICNRNMTKTVMLECDEPCVPECQD